MFKGQQVRRRDFITFVGAAAAGWPLAARAQAQQVARIGFLGVAPENPFFATSYLAFLAELRKLGFTEANTLIDHRRIDEGVSKAFAAAPN